MGFFRSIIIDPGYRRRVPNYIQIGKILEILIRWGHISNLAKEKCALMLSDRNGLKNISSAVRYHAETNPEKTYVISTNKKEYNFKQVNNLINSVCLLYKSLNLKQGTSFQLLLKTILNILFYI